MSACPLCRSRKGKRSCPALRETICPICCGRKRIVEIACPADCAYLERGSENDLRREILDYFQHQEPRLARRWVETVDRLPFLMEALEKIAAAAPRAIEDRDLLAALEGARQTFDTEAKGVIYESRSTSPTAELLRRELVEGVRTLEESLQEPEAEALRRSLPRWGPAEVAECLAVLADRCEYHIRRRDQAGTLIDHLRRIYVKSKGENCPSESPRIILA